MRRIIRVLRLQWLCNLGSRIPVTSRFNLELPPKINLSYNTRLIDNAGLAKLTGLFSYIDDHVGAVAQLGERCVRNAEVEGSIPFRSTNPSHGRKFRPFFMHAMSSRAGDIDHATARIPAGPGSSVDRAAAS
jgi:hypothetical protein